MNLSRIFILRPIATSLLMVALALSGFLAYRLLPISALPQIDYPTIQVLTLYPGASPEVSATSITAPLERQFGIMPGLSQMTSSSSSGASVIVLRFDLDISLDVAEQEVQAAINAAGGFLPSDLPNPPIYNKVNPADPPIMTIAVSSPSMPLTRLEDLVDTHLAQKISQLPGVGLVTMSGGQRPAVRVQANPLALASAGLSLDDVRTAIGNANVNQPKGSFDGPERASIIDANDQLRYAGEYADLVVTYSNGAPLRLRDVAAVFEGPEDIRLAAYTVSGKKDGGKPDAPGASDTIDSKDDAGNREELTAQPAIMLSVQRQPGANVIRVADSIKTLLPKIALSLPGSVDVRVLTDRTVTIRATVEDVQWELFLAFGLVVMVIFVFLHNVRATIIPGLAAPLSLIGTFGLMYLAGFSLNNLTLMALIIATGFVVDDAIVVIENISRYLERGDDPVEAALKGAGQIGFTILSLTFSLVAVLIPLLFMGDVVGRLFREFAVTLAVAILISAFISLTLTPMMCATLLKSGGRQKVDPKSSEPQSGDPDSGESANGGGKDTDEKQPPGKTGFFSRLLRFYDVTLSFVFNHQTATLLVALGTLALTIMLYIFVPKGFFPVQDTGLIQGIAEVSQSVSFDAMVRRQKILIETLARDPAVESVVVFIGVDGINPSLNSARLSIALKPLSERDDRAPVIAARLEAIADKMPGLTLYAQPVQDLTIEDRVSRTQYQFVLETLTHEDLSEWVPKIMSRLAALPEVSGLANDLRDNGRQAYVVIDRDAAGRLGVTAADITTALYSAFGQRQVSTIFTQTNQYHVVLEVAPEFRMNSEALRMIHVTSGAGTISGTAGGTTSGTVGGAASTTASTTGGATTGARGTGGVSATSAGGGSAVTVAAGTPGPGMAPLNSVARIEERPAVLSINRQGQFPASTFSFNVADGYSLGDSLAAIRKAQESMGLPQTTTITFEGAAYAFSASTHNQVWLLLAAVVTMYIVLGILYESFIHPVTILSTLPSAGMGALLALFLSRLDLGVVSVIGIILLIGIVKKNAIMMIDFALDAERSEGKSARDAIHQACLLRLRPILMTTMAALLGALPLMLGWGMGAELRRPLGVTMVGGLLFSQVLTLYTTPVIYLFFDRLSKKIKKRNVL